MKQLFLITQSEELSRSVELYFRFRGGVEVKTFVPPLLPKSVDRLGKTQWVPETFRKIAHALESHSLQVSGRASGLTNATCLIDVPDLSDLSDLDPIDRTKGWTGVVAMLILAFPEVHWVILSPFTPNLQQPSDRLKRFHFLQPRNLLDSVENIFKLRDQGFCPLFDPTGLRQLIHTLLAHRVSANYVPLRLTSAVAVDEEESYSYFHAYAAYRFGYRCHVITSYGLMGEILGDKSAEEISISFEDIYLNFPDRRLSLSKIRDRDAVFPKLTTIPNRIFVTSGHTNTKAEEEVTKANAEYLIELTAKSAKSRIYSATLYKPDTGVFDIWQRSGIRGRLTDGRAPFFTWPPLMINKAAPAGGTHSAPGRLLVIAESLISRANRLIKDIQSVPEAVYGATLAMNAQEYLGLRTPTTSLEAISLKHRFEVLAECMFYGVEYHLDTKSRFAEIENEMECVGVWFRKETRDISKLNTKIGLLSELVLIYREFNQFNEEQSALTKLRLVYRRLWYKRHRPWSYLILPFRWYFDQLLASVPGFMLALAFWILAYASLSYFAHYNKTTIGHVLEDSIITFFGMQPPHELWQLWPWGQTITLVLIMVGFVHLGIFISHVYALISRR